MAKKNPPVHVSLRDNGWAVVREGNDRATSVHPTQAEAAKAGRDIARRDQTGFMLHGRAAITVRTPKNLTTRTRRKGTPRADRRKRWAKQSGERVALSDKL